MKMKSRLLLTAMFILISFFANGCKYVSSFSATVCIHSNSSDSGSLQFGSLTGTYVFKMKPDSSNTLSYTAKLGSGTLKVYYDNEDEKKELFTLHSGETVDSSLTSLKSENLYLIVETDGKCENGDLSFTLK
ncbi:MAG: hypothetical protein IKQ49_11035 [Eubacterium sp.]|nr:hypothetical protein [Eubacterium sp.]